MSTTLAASAKAITPRYPYRGVAVPLDAFARPHGHGNGPLVADLFAGAGGFSLGFQLAGARIQAAVEYDAWACDTLRLNHEGTRVVQGDLTKLSDDELGAAVSGVDILIGGPPCQGYSVANGKAGDAKDPRNSLFREFVRAAALARPRIVLMENVPGLLKRHTADGTRVISVIAAELERLGYHVHVRILQAIDFGVPQLRPRLFVVGLRKDRKYPFPEPTHRPGDSASLSLFDTPAHVTLWDAISDLPQLDARQGAEVMPLTAPPETDYQELLRAGAEEVFNHVAMRHSARLVERFSSLRWGESSADASGEQGARKRGSPDELSDKAFDQNNRRMFPDRACHTIPASFYANFVHPYRHRNFTPREGARIQSFPDWYRFLGKPTVVSTKLLGREGRTEELHLCQYNQIGNAVPPLLAYNLGRHLAGLL
jgi:DNA (cytosine-5)-methyltransferase 1